MNSSTVEDIALDFNTKISNLKTCLMLRDSDDEVGIRQVMVALQSDLQELDVILALLRTEVRRGREQLDHAEEKKQALTQLVDCLTYTKANVPARMPQRTETVVESSERTVESDTRKPLAVKNVSQPAESCDVQDGMAKKKKPPGVYVPTMAYVTTDEFSAVPKYIKGRLKYDLVNTTVEEINKTFAGKYKILSLPRKALLKSDSLQTKVNEYKRQETKETKGLHFIVDSDVRNFTNLKLDPSYRTMLTILRFCRRLREVRGKNLTRYVMI